MCQLLFKIATKNEFQQFYKILIKIEFIFKLKLFKSASYFYLIINNIKYSLQLFIDNEFVDAASGHKFATINPANGKIIAQVSEGAGVKFIVSIIIIISYIET